MKIVITHLTRMKYPHICIAGRELGTDKMIRPVKGKLDVNLLEINGGIFALGNVVDLGYVRSEGVKPAIEDHSFQPYQAKKLSTLSSDEFWSILKKNARHELADIFGSELQTWGSSRIVQKGQGVASLGEIHVNRAKLAINPRGHLRLQLPQLDLSVTDLRFYNLVGEQFQLDRAKVAEVNLVLKKQPAILSVGLTRAFATKDDEGNPVSEEVHWLQINGICLESDPLWR